MTMASFTSLVTRPYIVLALIMITSFNLSNAKNPPATYVFGDSLVDVGNNNYLPVSVVRANYFPNGIDFPGGEATGRFCNGYNTVDWIAKNLSLPLSPPYLAFSTENLTAPLTGVSFASAAGGILNETNDYVGQCLSMFHQLQNFQGLHQELEQRLGQAAAQEHFSKSIFAIVIGSNDVLFYTSSSSLREDIPPGPYVDSMAATFKEHIKRLHALGARKFVFAGLGPVGCVPARRIKTEGEECEELSNSMAVMFNNKTKSMLPSLSSQLKGFSYIYSDVYTLLNNFIQSPDKYGFAEVKAACCGYGELYAKTPCLPFSDYCSFRTEYIFWDSHHPTQAANEIIANAILDGPPKLTFPMNLRQLLAV